MADETLLSKLMNGAVTEGDGDLLNLVIRDGVTELGCLEFYNHKRLASVKIPPNVTKIDDLAFQDCASLTELKYNGTIAQWEAVKKAENWNKDVPAKTVKCSDGEVKLEYKE